MTGDFDKWRAAVAGADPGKLGIHLDEPWCGYFAVQDRSSTVKASRWPLIAGAIWRAENGDLVAERGGIVVPVDWVWPYCASRPITYERYQFWHEHKHWPKETKAA